MNKQLIINHLSDTFEKSNIIKNGIYYSMNVLHERKDVHKGKLITATFNANCIVERNNVLGVELSKHFLYSSIDKIWDEITKYKTGVKQKKPIIVKEHNRLLDILSKYDKNNTTTNVYYVAPKVENTIHVYSPGFHGLITVEDKATTDLLFFIVICSNASGFISNPHIYMDLKVENRYNMGIIFTPLAGINNTLTVILNNLPKEENDVFSLIVYGGHCRTDEKQTDEELRYIQVTTTLSRATDLEMINYFNSIIPLEISIFLDKIHKGALMLDIYKQYNKLEDIGHLMNGIDLDNKIEVKDYIEGYLLDLYVKHRNSENSLWIKNPKSEYLGCPMHKPT